MIEQIKHRILELDAGSFQNLCDAYLSAEGYAGMMSLGGKAGTKKTTRGTPDTYFIDEDGNYIFVEYTTQQDGLIKKIEKDIDKCLDESSTEIEQKYISKIIYCHTSSNITPKQHRKLLDLCSSAGIELELVGIDMLANDLFNKHPDLITPHLQIPLITGQIQTVKQFIGWHDGQREVAPLETHFMFRKNEMDNIEKAFQNVDLVILTGKAGVGKTRLALNFVEKYSSDHKLKPYVIHDNGLEIDSDLLLFFKKNGTYFLVIDDANMLTGLTRILDFLNDKVRNLNLKIIITVRDYALDEVKMIISNYYEAIEIPVGILTDEEIIRLLETEFKITNNVYIERILNIAQGNARMALFAGKIASESNDFNSIQDASGIYDYYYCSFFEKDGVANPRQLRITAGIIAFLTTVDLKNLDDIVPILEKLNIDKTDFIKCATILHEDEMIDIYKGQIARLDDQSFQHYVLKLVFIDKRDIRISDMIGNLFWKYKSKVVNSINDILYLYQNDNVIECVKSEIKEVWRKLEDKDSDRYRLFVLTFHLADPISTLLFINKEIELEEKTEFDPDNIKLDNLDRNSPIQNEIIKLIGNFAGHEEFPEALELYFSYYLKRPDLFEDFYTLAVSDFGINEQSASFRYSIQITFFKSLKESLINGFSQEIIFLFLALAKEFLKLHFTPIKVGMNNKIVFSYFCLMETEGVQEYRNLIWEILLTIVEADYCKEHKERIFKILWSYGKESSRSSTSIVKSDNEYIEQIVNQYFDQNEIQNCILVGQIVRILNYHDIKIGDVYSNYINNSKYKIVSLLQGNSKSDYDSYLSDKKEKVKGFIVQDEAANIKRVIEIAKDVEEYIPEVSYLLCEGMLFAFDSLENEAIYCEAVKYYLESNTPQNLEPCTLVRRLFQSMNVETIFSLISERNFDEKNSWMYAYFHEMPNEQISRIQVDQLYSFLSDNSDSHSELLRPRDVSFLTKFKSVDPEAYVKGSRVILSKKEYSPGMIRIYFESVLFDSKKGDQMIAELRDDLELLEEVYFSLLALGNFSDQNGDFLLKLYELDKNIHIKYVNNVKYIENTGFDEDLYHTKNNFNRYYLFARAQGFFQLPNYLSIFSEMVRVLSVDEQKAYICLNELLRSVLDPQLKDKGIGEKEEHLIERLICQFNQSNFVMGLLFGAIWERDSDFKKKYYLQFIEKNNSVEHFQKLLNLPTLETWTHSVESVYRVKITFLQSLLPELRGLNYLPYKQAVVEKIESLKRRLSEELIWENLNSY